LRSVLTLGIYLTPFLLIGVGAMIWMRRRGIALSDVRAEGDPNRKSRPRFLLGSWRNEGRE
jgi:hypothetical protein